MSTDRPRRAQKFATRLDLRVDEVLQFKRNFYAKLVDAGGNGATEVLIDPASGVVSLEYGPAMMWNTKYGMMTRRGATNMVGRYGTSMMGGLGHRMMDGSGNGYGAGMMGGSGGMMRGSGGMMGGSYGHGGSGGAGSATTNVTLAQAHTLAQRWLTKNEPGVTVETGGDTFPGYYTMETLNSGAITGMISVNATTGTVWPHWWHGTFVATSG